MNRHQAPAAAPGYSLPELLVAVAVLGLLAALSISSGSETLARQRLEVVARRLDQGLNRARAEAQRQGVPCGLSLQAEGWRPPGDGSGLPPCFNDPQRLSELVGGAEVRISHNLPAQLRFSRNGLVLDGGTVVLSTAGTDLQRCLVMALPMGITRLGRYGPGGCQPDPTL